MSNATPDMPAVHVQRRAGQIARMSDDDVNTLVTDETTIDALLDDLLPYEQECGQGTGRRFEEQEEPEFGREWDGGL